MATALLEALSNPSAFTESENPEDSTGSLNSFSSDLSFSVRLPAAPPVDGNPPVSRASFLSQASRNLSRSASEQLRTIGSASIVPPASCASSRAGSVGPSPASMSARRRLRAHRACLMRPQATAPNFVDLAKGCRDDPRSTSASLVSTPRLQRRTELERQYCPHSMNAAIAAAAAQRQRQRRPMPPPTPSQPSLPQRTARRVTCPPRTYPVRGPHDAQRPCTAALVNDIGAAHQGAGSRGDRMALLEVGMRQVLGTMLRDVSTRPASRAGNPTSEPLPKAYPTIFDDAVSVNDSHVHPPHSFTHERARLPADAWPVRKAPARAQSQSGQPPLPRASSIASLASAGTASAAAVESTAERLNRLESLMDTLQSTLADFIPMLRPPVSSQAGSSLASERSPLLYHRRRSHSSAGGGSVRLTTADSILTPRCNSARISARVDTGAPATVAALTSPVAPHMRPPSVSPAIEPFWAPSTATAKVSQEAMLRALQLQHLANPATPAVPLAPATPTGGASPQPPDSSYDFGHVSATSDSEEEQPGVLAHLYAESSIMPVNTLLPPTPSAKHIAGANDSWTPRGGADLPDASTGSSGPTNMSTGCAPSSVPLAPGSPGERRPLGWRLGRWPPSWLGACLGTPMRAKVGQGGPGSSRSTECNSPNQVASRKMISKQNGVGGEGPT